jgi:hypothetical protein
MIEAPRIDRAVTSSVARHSRLSGQAMSPLATARRGRSVWLRVGLAATAALALAVLTAVLELPSVGGGSSSPASTRSPASWA